MTLGEQIKKAREAAKMTQDDVEARFDFPASTINNLERGQFSGLYLSQLQRMADFFKVAFIIYPREAPSNALKKRNSKNV